MENYKEDTITIKEKIVEINMGLLEHRVKLLEMFEKLQDPSKDLVLLQYDEIMKNWKKMVETQRIVINRMEQEALLSSIEIVGLPEKYGKDIPGVAKILSKLLHISITDNYINNFERIGHIINPETQNPRTLVVHLVDQNIKKRILTVADFVVLSVPGSDIPMYITEHLTPENHRLFLIAREEALRHHINNVWVEDGKIFMRSSLVSFPYEIRCEADITRMTQF